MRIDFVAKAHDPGGRYDRWVQIVEELARQGHDVRHVLDGGWDEDTDAVLLMIGTVPFFPATFRRLRGTPPERRPFSVLWQTESLPPPAESGLRPARRSAREWAKIVRRDPRTDDARSNLRQLLRAQRDGLPELLVMETGWRLPRLAAHGIEAEWVPFGSGPASGRDLGVERDIDVLFVGSQDVPRRRRIVRRLRRAGVDVRCEGGWDSTGLWGERRTEVVNRAKIMLNVARHPGELSSVRFFIGMACRSCVVSEPVWDPRPFEPGVHYAEAPVEDLATLIEDLLADDARRQAIADAGHRFALEDATNARSIARLAGVIAAARGGVHRGSR